MRHASLSLLVSALAAACALPPRTTARPEDGAASNADRSTPDAITEAGADSATLDDASAIDADSAMIAMDGGRDALPDALPDAPPDVRDAAADTGVARARITGRVRFLSSGSITVSFNGVAQVFNAAANAAPITFDVLTPVPMTMHSIAVTANTSGQTCSVRLPTPTPTTELTVNGVEVRCVLAANNTLTDAMTEQTISLPSAAAPPQRDLTEVPEFVVNQPDEVSVLAAVTVPVVRFPSVNSLGVVEVGFVDQPSGAVLGRINVRRANGNTRTMHLSASAILRLSPGMHRIRPTFRHVDVPGRPAALLVYGVRPAAGITVASQGSLDLTYSAVVLDSLSTYEGSAHSTWMPTAAEPALATVNAPLTIPLVPALRPTIPANGGALYSFTPPLGYGPVQWDLLADGATLARGAAYYDDAPMPHAMITMQPSATAITPAVTATLTRYNYRNSFGPPSSPVTLRASEATSFDGTMTVAAPITPALLSIATFRSGVRMFAQRQTGASDWYPGTAPAPTPLPATTPVHVSLAQPRKVLVSVRLASGRVGSDGPFSDLTIGVRSDGGALRTLTQVTITSSNAQNSQGVLMTTIVELPAGEHDINFYARAVTSVGEIPPGGITTGYAMFATPDQLDTSQRLGHLSVSALVLE